MDALYASYVDEEATAKSALISFEDKSPDVLEEDNLADILGRLLKEQSSKD